MIYKEFLHLIMCKQPTLGRRGILELQAIAQEELNSLAESELALLVELDKKKEKELRIAESKAQHVIKIEDKNVLEKK